MDQCIAHLRRMEDGQIVSQTVEAHARQTAACAAARLKAAGLESAGYLAGLLHDLGKCTEKFFVYLKKAFQGEPVRRGSVNHTFAGAIFLLERYHGTRCASYGDIAAEVLAYAVGAHHGLFDCVGPNGVGGFAHRLEYDRTELCYEEAVRNFIAQCAGYEELDALFARAAEEIKAFAEKAAGEILRKKSPGSPQSGSSEALRGFFFSFLCRLLLSALIDADRRDTAEFMTGTGTGPDAGPEADPELWKSRLAFLENKLADFPMISPVDLARGEISAACRRAADRCEGGIFRLSVPTGSGKTLAALRFALENADRFGKKRIFFIMPLLTIIEQNAGVLREYLGDDGLILEHHSDLVKIRDSADQDSRELDERELLLENWRSPVVVTTLVQFLNTLFSGRTSCVRRLQALTDSVIVIDEVQSMPGKMASLVTGALNFLTCFCGATVVLSSATQPCFDQIRPALWYAPETDLVPFSPRLWAPFRRTEIMDARRPQGYSAGELAGFAAERMGSADSLLFICNTKSETKEVFTLLCALPGRDFELFHLSAAMCMAHRKETLSEINRRLRSKKRVLCVATQLVEAGVDFSFERVVRLLAGLDNVAQAAGRCNRNGEFGRICPVYLVNFRAERLDHLPEIRASRDAAEDTLAAYGENPSCFQNAPLSDETIRYYYGKLFGVMKTGFTGFALPELSTSIYELLSANPAFAAHTRQPGRYWINQAFQTAGSRFQVFEDNTEEVIVPYDKTAEGIIADLCSDRARRDLAFLGRRLEAAKPYSISIFGYQKKRLEKNGGLYTGQDGAFLALQPGFYSYQTGLDEEGNSEAGRGGAFC